MVGDRSYVDFDLEIESIGTGYRARVLESPAGQANANISLPFTDLEIENFILRIGQRRRGRRRIESRDLDTAREFGSKLFQAVMFEDIAGAYRSSILSSQERNTGLRVRLRLSGAPGLVDIPWEFLFDPTARRFVALSMDSPIVRFLDVPGTTNPLKITPPIKVLVVIASPSDFEPLQVEDEWLRLNEAVNSGQGAGMIALERLAKPTLTEFQRALRRNYHVLHFVGHGGFDEQRQDGLLVFEDDQGRGNEVSATYLSTLLHDADSLRLAVLNACDGARSSRQDQFAGVAQSLLQQGVPAVVAMQFEISDEAALTFAREFYGAFAEGYPVEAALAEARKSMFAQQNDSEWATPVLYLRSPGNSIFEITPLPPEAVAAAPVESDPIAASPAAPDPVAADPVAGAAPATVPVAAVTAAPPTEEDVAAAVAPPEPEPEPGPGPGPLKISRAPERLPAPAREPEPALPVVRAASPIVEKEASPEEEAPPRQRQTSPWAPKPERGGNGGFPLKKILIGLAAILILGLAASFFYAGIVGDEDDPDDDDTSATATPFPTDEAGNPITPIPEPGDFSGQWWTNFAFIEIEQEGVDVLGSYIAYLGGPQRKSIKGRVEGNQLYATFDGDIDPLVFELNEDGDAFEGYWVDRQGKPHEWCGSRDEELPDGCGYSGDWKSKGLPIAMELKSDTFRVTQSADTAVMEFESWRYGETEFGLSFDPAVLADAAGIAEMSEGSQTLRFEIKWSLAEDANWDAISGTWRPLLPSPGAVNSWCAWRGEAQAPC